MPSVPATSDRDLLRLLADWIDLANRTSSEESFLEQALQSLRAETRADAAAWVANVRGIWRVEAGAGGLNGLSPEFFANAADAETPLRQGTWLAVPVSDVAATNLLVISQRSLDTFGSWIAVLARAIVALRHLIRQHQQGQSWIALRKSLDGLFDLPRIDKHLAPKVLATLEHQVSAAIHAQWAKFRPVDGHPSDAPLASGQSHLEIPLATKGGHARSQLHAGREVPWSVEDERFLAELLHEFEPIVSASLNVLSARSPSAATDLIGESHAMNELRRRIARIAPTELTVLIRGENGTGKEIVSRLIHELSPRAAGPLLAVNCAALTETLLESELFGHEKGAFTDAHESRAGKFELAHGGTLFLDEIAELSPRGQAQLLRVLEEKTLVRVGGHEPIPVDTRLLAATHRDLAEMVNAETFRRDLFFRLNVVVLALPPLRERDDDIRLLAEHFLEQAAKQRGRPCPRLTNEAVWALRAYPWPGNVRELRNLMERVCYLYDDDPLDVHHLALSNAAITTPFDVDCALSLADATRQFQIAYIEHHLRGGLGRMTETAERLGLHRTNLYRKMKQLGMTPPG